MIVKRMRVILLVDVVPEGELASDIAEWIEEDVRSGKSDVEDVRVESAEFVEELPA